MYRWWYNVPKMGQCANSVQMKCPNDVPMILKVSNDEPMCKWSAKDVTMMIQRTNNLPRMYQRCTNDVPRMYQWWCNILILCQRCTNDVPRMYQWWYNMNNDVPNCQWCNNNVSMMYKWCANVQIMYQWWIKPVLQRCPNVFCQCDSGVKQYTNAIPMGQGCVNDVKTKYKWCAKDDSVGWVEHVSPSPWTPCWNRPAGGQTLLSFMLEYPWGIWWARWNLFSTSPWTPCWNRPAWGQLEWA